MACGVCALIPSISPDTSRGPPMSLVSVIMPTYNAEKWVTDAIDNLKAQTWRNLELIIVDDASSDTTVAVARKKLEKDFDRAWKIIEVERRSEEHTSNSSHAN